jgi:hypothetical protein
VVDRTEEAAFRKFLHLKEQAAPQKSRA